MRNLVLSLLCCCSLTAFASPYFSYCYNSGDAVSYSFTSCVSRNFDEAARSFDSSPYLSYCFNSGDDSLDYSFTSCVNRNFDRIDSELSELGHSIYFSYCYESGDTGVSYSFQSCVNRNFDRLAREFPLD
jgi:hypothetical protein